MASIADQLDAPTPAGGPLPLYEGKVRRITVDGVLVDLAAGGSVGPTTTSLTVAEGDWVLVAAGRLRTWIVEVQPA